MDSIERVQWVSCAFSSSGDYVIAAAGSKNMHNIYIWDQHMGNLVKMLEGPMESILDLKVLLQLIMGNPCKVAPNSSPDC